MYPVLTVKAYNTLLGPYTMAIETRLSSTPFDEEHVTSNCDVISDAAMRFQDKVIYTGPLVYISCSGRAVVLDAEDQYACILADGTTRYLPWMGEVNGQFSVSWPQNYLLDDGQLTVIDNKTDAELLVMALYPEIYDLVLKYGA